MYGLHKIAETLQESGCVLEGVPGFYRDPEERWTLNFKTKNSGFLVPVESMDGKIQACQIRLDHPRDNNKYLWFSSAGYPHGVSSGSPVHVIGDLDAENVYLTEGGLKGSIAHYLSGHTFICLAGVNMYRSLRPVLEEFQRRKMKFLFEAFDMDKKLKTDCDKHYHKCSVCSEKGTPENCPYKVEKRRIIQNACGKVYGICQELSLPVSRMVWDQDVDGNWNGKIKGIDDYYYAERAATSSPLQKQKGVEA